MELLPMTLSEAVIRYIEKRKTVTPRPVEGDLTQYMMNPQANSYSECDWLHLGADVALARPSGRTYRTRYTLALGLKSTEAEAPTGPAQHAKHFASEDITTTEVSFSFAALARKLPVTVTTRARRFAITANAACEKFAIADEKAADGVIGRGVSVDITLVNKGDADMTVEAALAPMTMQQYNPGVWPPSRGKDAVKVNYGGHYRAVGPYRKPATEHQAALFMTDTPAAIEKLAVSAGYNFGLVALKRSVTIKAGSATRAPLLFVVIEKPKPVESVDPISVVNAVTAALKKAL
jgi:hypothetical protein